MLSPSTVTSPRGHPLLSTAGLYSMHNSFRVPRPGWMVGAQDVCNNLIVEGVLGQSGSEDSHRREEGIPFPPFTQVSESSQT